MPTRAIRINTAGEPERTPDLVESSEVAAVPTANAVLRADVNGKIASGWISAVPFAALPVAANGEVSETNVVRADDSRLGNPAVGGDLSGTAASATVVRVQGRAVASAPPEDGQGLIWNHTANQWEPGTVASSGGGGGNATQIQGRDVSAVAPSVGETLVWNGTAWAPGAGSGEGDESVGNKLILFERYT